jgi:hypothetical protein
LEGKCIDRCSHQVHWFLKQKRQLIGGDLANKDFPSFSLAKERKLLERGVEGGSLFCTTHCIELGFGFALVISLGRDLQFGMEFWQRQGVRLRRK